MLGVCFLFGGGYFAARLAMNPEIGEIIVMPIYIGFAVIAALVCFTISFVFYLLRRKR